MFVDRGGGGFGSIFGDFSEHYGAVSLLSSKNSRIIKLNTFLQKN